MRRRGEISAAELAAEVGVSDVTVRRWAARALDGESSKLLTDEVRFEPVSERYWISEDAIERLLRLTRESESSNRSNSSTT